MAIDPECFTGREKFKKDMDRYIKSIKESAKAQNVTEILIPGEPEYRTESERMKHGIPLDSTTVQEVVSLGKSLGIPLSLMG
jgi:LDH2 family malate/lactate/ureidoglycolate dehydrogenase